MIAYGSLGNMTMLVIITIWFRNYMHYYIWYLKEVYKAGCILLSTIIHKPTNTNIHLNQI